MLRVMSETGDPELIGRRVANKFFIEKFLGGGAMGAVYRARDDSLERNVALKVMHPAVAVDPSFVSRFHREARAASRLDHPNSMRVIEYGEEPDGLLYIAMEYLEGRDLYKVIHEDWPLPEARIADIMMKALAAIAVAHEMGVIHRDLKPENIMILNRKDDEGQDIVKVCDFGIAKITEKDDDAPGGPPKTAGQKLTTAGLVVGTPEYMSPEQARGEKLDARSDLYSMGIILYQLLTGRTPFLADTALAVVLKHISEQPEPPRTIYPGVHKGLESVSLKALAKVRDDRFQAARDMRAAIKAAIEGRPMPVDSSAATAVDAVPAGGGVTSTSTSTSTSTGAAVIGPQTGPQLAAAASGHNHNPTQPMSSPPPNVGVAMSKVTPLGTSQVMPSVDDKPRSRGLMFAGVALLAFGIGAAGVVYVQKNGMPSSLTTPTATTTPTTTSTGSVTSSPTTVPSMKITAEPGPSSGPKAHPTGKNTSAPPPPPPPSHANSHSSNASTNPTTTAVEPTPVPPPEPAPVPTPTAAPTPTPTVAPPPTPTAAPFNAATCKAVSGQPRSVSGYNVRDFSIRDPNTAYTTCARSSVKERPAAPIAATVRVRFNDSRSFKGATCNGCPGALAQCVTSATKGITSVNFKSGDVTGDPEFEVPVTFSCE
jgi:eukaryotic-like serine/threonine-protein kinase